jgi:outer membrane lipoprotein-sorting protein
MRFKWVIFFLFPVILNAQEVKMTEAEIKAFKNGVSVSSKNTTSLSSDFIQTKHMSFLSKPIETKGSLSYQAPGLVLWKYTQPFQYAVIFRENKIYINDAGKKSDVNLGNSKMFSKLNKLIVGSISGDMFDEKEFTIAYFKVGGKPMARFVTKDTNIKKYLKQIELYFENNTVSEVKMTEPTDDYTKIVFKNKVLNAKIDPRVFTP